VNRIAGLEICLPSPQRSSFGHCGPSLGEWQLPRIGCPRIIWEVRKFLQSHPFKGKRVVMGIVADRTGAGLPAIQEMHEKRIGPDAAIFIHGGYQDAIDARQPTFHNVAQRNLIESSAGSGGEGGAEVQPHPTARRSCAKRARQLQDDHEPDNRPRVLRCPQA
jgi:hypothetical protein